MMLRFLLLGSIFITGVLSAPVYAQEATTAPAQTQSSAGGNAPEVKAETTMTPLSWENIGDTGMMNIKEIAPSGDILDSGMDALAPLGIAPVNIPEFDITPDLFKNPVKASAKLKEVLFLPEENEKSDKDKKSEITPEKTYDIAAVRKRIMDQTASYGMTLGVKAEHNVNKIQDRLLRAKTLSDSADHIRHEIVLLNGVTLGQLAETNKVLGLMATYAILSASDMLTQQPSSFTGLGSSNYDANQLKQSLDQSLNKIEQNSK